MHPPNPQTNRAACQGRSVRKEIISTADDTETSLTLQQQKVRRLYAVSFATAVTIARLAFAVAA